MEAIEIGEIIDIANIDAVFMHVVENMVERQKGLGEYPTLSATSETPLFSCSYILGGCPGGCDVNLPTKRLGERKSPESLKAAVYKGFRSECPEVYYPWHRYR